MQASDIRKHYDPVLMKMFSSVVQPFPIGAKLTLQNGQCGVVVRHDPRDPFKPKIVVAFDAFGDPLSEEMISKIHVLGESDDLKIKSFVGEDLSALNEEAPEHEDSQPAWIDSGELFDYAFP